LLAGLGELPAPSGIFAQIGGAAISIPAAALRERAFHSPSFLRLILRFAQSNASQADQSVACNALHNVSARLARWLLMTDDRVGNDTVPLTQEYLAVMVGVQRTTVSAAAAELKAAKLIRYVRGRIEIIDRQGLEQRACECYDVIHSAFARLGDGTDS
jgi:CRP-like cAMP-binding protein